MMHKSEITIRPYLPSDRAALIAIFNSNVPKFFAPEELHDFESWLNGKDAGNVNAYKQTEFEHFFVVEQMEKVVACGGFYTIRGERRANMLWGMVHASLHRQGIGREFMMYRLQQIETLYPGYAITLDTTQFSAPFFERLGFVTTKVTADYYAKGLDRHDMVKP